jgi:hypothetical protein
MRLLKALIPIAGTLLAFLVMRLASGDLNPITCDGIWEPQPPRCRDAQGNCTTYDYCSQGRVLEEGQYTSYCCVHYFVNVTPYCLQYFGKNACCRQENGWIVWKSRCRRAGPFEDMTCDPFDRCT